MTNGAQKAGSCRAWLGPFNMFSIDRRKASAFLTPGSSRRTFKKPVVKPTVGSLATAQLETRSDRAPAWKKARAKPENPSENGPPSGAAVLQAERMTRSALALRAEIS